MKVIPFKQIQKTNVSSKLEQIPFFADLAAHNSNELKAMLEHSELINLDPGEILIEHGSYSRSFYVLLTGKLDVFAKEPENFAITQLTGAQILGALGTVNHQARTATLAASRDCEAQVLAIDYSIFGSLLDFSTISLDTKLKLYNNIVSNTRWKLEMYKRETADLTLAQQLTLYPSFKGKKGTAEHLQYLSRQAQGLGELLECWNQCIEPSVQLPELESEEGSNFFNTFISSMKGLLNKKVI